MANPYVHASDFGSSIIDARISQRVGIIDDNPQRIVWMVSKRTDGANAGDLQVSTIYTLGGAAGPEQISGDPFPLTNTFTTRSAIFFDQSANPLVTASAPTISAGSGQVVITYCSSIGNINSIILRTIPTSMFATMVSADFTPEVVLDSSTTNQLLNPVVDMGPSGVVHGSWINRGTRDSIIYANTTFLTKETVFETEAGATIDEATIIVDKDDIVHIIIKYTLGWLNNSTIIYMKKDWANFPIGGWEGLSLFDFAPISNMQGLSAVLDETGTFYIGYAAGSPRKAYLTSYNHITEANSTVTFDPAWGGAVNMVSMAIDEDNNPHMGWTEDGIDDRFFHIDYTSIYADQVQIEYVGDEPGGFDTQRINLAATNQMAYFGAPAVGVFGKQTYRAVLGFSPRYISSTLGSIGQSLPSYSVLPLGVRTFIPHGGMIATGLASLSSTETQTPIGGALVSPSHYKPEWIKEQGSGGAKISGRGLDSLSFYRFGSGGAKVGSSGSISVILDKYNYIVNEDTAIIEIDGISLVETGDLPLGLSRSFVLTDLICVYSGGSNNQDPTLSIGGAPSVFEIQGNFNNLFDDITPTEAEEDFTDYRAFYIFNDNPTETIYNIKIWVKEEATGGADVTIGLEDRDEIQNIVIDQDITSGSFRIQYEPSNPDAVNPVIVNFDPDISNWANNLQNALNGINDLNDVEVIASSLSTGVSFDIRFTEQDGKRLQELLQITENNLVPAATITVTRQIGGKPINSIATSLDSATTPPTGVVFSSPTVGAPLTVPKLREGEGFAVWLKRSAVAGVTAVQSDGIIVRISVEPIP